MNKTMTQLFGKEASFHVNVCLGTSSPTRLHSPKVMYCKLLYIELYLLEPTKLLASCARDTPSA